MIRTAILISGGGSNMVKLVESMGAANHPATPALVLSNRPDAGGLAKAQALGVPTAVVDHKEFPKDRAGFDAALHSVLTAHKIDLICLAGFMRIFTPGFVQKWPQRILNIHPSLLPKYPGLNTHARALEAKDAQAGCSVHWVIDALDAGPVLGQAVVATLPDDTAESLAARVLVEEHRLYPAVLFDVAKSFVRDGAPVR